MRRSAAAVLLTVLVLVLGALVFLNIRVQTDNTDQPLPVPTETPADPPSPSAAPTPSTSPTSQDFSDLPYVHHPQVPILMYHEVNDALENNLYLSVADFRSHLDYFAEAGITPITMEQLWDHWTNQAPLPEKPIVLTFDDGYRSMYTTVYPLLRERGWPGTFYCIAEAVWSEAFVLEEMIGEMAAGGMEIGSHTKSHVELDGLTGDSLSDQLTLSRDSLAALSGAPVTQLCYPSGRYNAETMAAAEAAGYHCAVTTEYGFAAPEQGLFALKRIRINTGDTGETLRSILSPLGY